MKTGDIHSPYNRQSGAICLLPNNPQSTTQLGTYMYVVHAIVTSFVTYHKFASVYHNSHFGVCQWWCWGGGGGMGCKCPPPLSIIMGIFFLKLEESLFVCLFSSSGPESKDFHFAFAPPPHHSRFCPDLTPPPPHSFLSSVFALLNSCPWPTPTFEILVLPLSLTIMITDFQNNFLLKASYSFS